LPVSLSNTSLGKKRKEKLPIMSFSYPSASMKKEHWFIVHVAAKQTTTF
jgi:hypothetical protein